MSTTVILQVQDDAPPGRLATWARQRGVTLDVRRADHDAPLPDPRAYSSAIVLGSAASLAVDPPAWADRLLDWLRAADAAAVPVLGICFGGQAVAAAHGGRVRRAPRPEVGLVAFETSDPGLIPGGPWVTWHEDVVDLPPQAREIARNAVGPQAFRVGHAVGVQFHPEATAAILRDWVDADQGRALARVGLERGALDEAARAADPQIEADAFRLFDRVVVRAAVPATRP